MVEPVWPYTWGVGIQRKKRAQNNDIKMSVSARLMSRDRTDVYMEYTLSRSSFYLSVYLDLCICINTYTAGVTFVFVIVVVNSLHLC